MDLERLLVRSVAPGLPAGANQINVLLPADATPGAISIVWTVGTVSSNACLFVQLAGWTRVSRVLRCRAASCAGARAG